MSRGTSIKDSIHGLIQLSAYERKIISTPGFNRLHDVYQNSTVYMTFPCNRTKRYEHSIGTMKLCSDMFYQSILNADESDRIRFFNRAKKHIDDIILKINSQKTDFNCDDYLAGKMDFSVEYLRKVLNIDERRRAFVPYGVLEEFSVIQIILMESLRTAALLHDIGHPPFSHIIEYALENVYSNLKGSQKSLTVREDDFLLALDPFFEEKGKGTARKLHEQMGDLIVDNILKSIIEPYTKKDYRIESVEPVENLFAIIVYHVVFKIYHDESFFSSLHRLIDSEVDGDRLDYLTRDPENSGVDLGRIDYNRIISDMRLCYIEDEAEIKNENKDGRQDNLFFFCYPTKAINSIENVFRRRYTFYSDIVYHHHVTKTDFLLMSSVGSLICEYLSNNEESTQPEAPSLLPFDISGLWYPLKDKQRRGREKMKNNLVQWNDSWLMTVLKQIYYREYENLSLNDCEISTERRKIYKQLSELLLNDKYYFSLTKRSNNFKVLDNEIKRGLSEKIDDISKLEENAKRVCNGNLELNEASLMLQDLQILCMNITEPNSFIAQFLFKRYDSINKESGKFSKVIEDAASFALSSMYQNNVEDFIVAPVNLNVGANEKSRIYFYEAGKNNKYVFQKLSDLSDIIDILDFEIQHFPPFYLYIALDDPEKNTPELEEATLKLMGRNIAEGVFHDIEECLTNISGVQKG